jgi:hypothetical protein
MTAFDEGCNFFLKFAVVLHSSLGCGHTEVSDGCPPYIFLVDCNIFSSQHKGNL